MKSLKINGAEKTFPQGLPETLSLLLQHLDVNAATVVAEINGTIIKRECFDTTILKDGQTVELIRFVGGG